MKLRTYLSETSRHTWKQIISFTIVMSFAIAVFFVVLFITHSLTTPYIIISMIAMILFGFGYASIIIWEERRDISLASGVSVTLSEFGLTVEITEDGYYNVTGESDECEVLHLTSDELVNFADGVRVGYVLNNRQENIQS